MGKRLIIKGADFSTNRIPEQVTWYVNEYDQAVALGRNITNSADPAVAGFSPNYDFAGKTINYFKMKVYRAGTVSLWVGNSRTDSSATKVGEITLTSEEVGQVVTKQIDPITVPSGKVFWMCKSGDTGTFAYSNQKTSPGSTLGAFWIYLGTGTAKQDSSPYEMLCVNIGYIS